MPGAAISPSPPTAFPIAAGLSPNIYYAHGYSGQGVALAGMYGKLMAECVRGQSERFDLLARVKHLPFPGGPIRTPLLVAAMLFYRLRDALSCENAEICRRGSGAAWA